jgi:hypothetical protein
MKTFKQLREAVSKKDAESDALKPRAKGEQDFANAHTQTVTDYPAKGDSFETDDKIAKSKHHGVGGERSVIKQGTSDLADKSGFKEQQTKTRANSVNGNGDKTPVRGPSSAQAYAEEVFSNRSTITESSEETYEIELENGDVVEVNEETLDIITDTYSKLNPENQEMFRDMINQSADSFSTIMDFVASNVEVE